MHATVFLPWSKEKVPYRWKWLDLNPTVQIRLNLIYSSEHTDLHTVVLCNKHLCCTGDCAGRAYNAFSLTVPGFAKCRTSLFTINLPVEKPSQQTLSRSIVLLLITSFKPKCFSQPPLLPRLQQLLPVKVHQPLSEVVTASNDRCRLLSAGVV